MRNLGPLLLVLLLLAGGILLVYGPESTRVQLGASDSGSPDATPGRPPDESTGDSPFSTDERVLGFPAAARRTDEGWRVRLHGWVFEPEKDSVRRRLLLEALGEGMDLDEDEDDEDAEEEDDDAKTPEGGEHEDGGATRDGLFERRAQWFLADNESGKPIHATLGGKTFPLGQTADDGHFIAPVTLSDARARKHDEEGWLHFAVAGRPGVRLSAHLVPPEGISVISDIDDTVKITEVTDREQLLRNTFLRPFRAVEGMAKLYRRWFERGASFHYVSASPWQLYKPLSEFFAEQGFPHGTFHLRRVHFAIPEVVELLERSGEAKAAKLESFLEAYPDRRFVLVGDSGEADPELYGELARNHPKQIRRIYIRNVTGTPASASRYQTAFAGVPRARWRVFDDPGALNLPR
jgi:phosphatidate phosphatase APP1